MPDALTRADAIATLEEGQAKLDALFARLSDEAMERPKTIGGGDTSGARSGWSAKDLLGHVAFWEELAADVIEAHRTGRQPRVAAIFSGDGSVDRANAENQARSAAMSLADVRQRAATAHRALVDGIRSLADDEWGALPTYESPRQRPLGELLGGITGAKDRPFGHAWAHLDDLGAYAKGAGTSTA
jgi:hypothetical protein